MEENKYNLNESNGQVNQNINNGPQPMNANQPGQPSFNPNNIQQNPTPNVNPTVVQNSTPNVNPTVVPNSTPNPQQNLNVNNSNQPQFTNANPAEQPSFGNATPQQTVASDNVNVGSDFKTPDSIMNVSNLNKEEAMEEALSHTTQYTPFEVPKEDIKNVEKTDNKKAIVFIIVIFIIMLLFILFLPQISELLGLV